MRENIPRESSLIETNCNNLTVWILWEIIRESGLLSTVYFANKYYNLDILFHVTNKSIYWNEFYNNYRICRQLDIVKKKSLVRKSSS